VQTLDERNARINEVEQLSASLESRVQARTRDLRIAAEVSKQITTVLDIDTLLQQVVQLTVASFDLYACFVFRMDEESGVLTFAAGADETGVPLDTTEYRTLTTADPQGIIARAAREREVIVIQDTAQSPDFRAVTPLPETRAEVAVPMVLGNRIIGIFDVQSRRANRFTDEEVAVLTTLAEQTAIAMRNAQLYSEAQAATEEAEEANRVKSQFLANMSHELRTPLNAILNFAEFMADGDLGPVNDDQVDALNKVIGSGEHLLSLINDILDITKIEVGMLELFIEEVDVNQSLKSVVATGRGLVKDRPVDLATDIEPDLPRIKGDRRRLHQVFLNLLSNAIKFTPQGKVTISAKCHDDALHITVSDTGVGIAPEEQGSVFESFRQAEYGRQTGAGTGLGLPISKHFIEAHGGTITLESAPDVGTTFHVRLPLEAAPAIKEADA
jgi:signal transduction histidine kinase